MPIPGSTLIVILVSLLVFWILRVRSQRQHQAEIKEMKRAGTLHRFQDLERFAAGIAHDMNNTLMVIDGNTSLLKVDRERAMEQIVLSVQQGRAFNRRLMHLFRCGATVVGLVEVDEHLEELQVVLRRILPFDTRLELDLGVPGGQVQITPSELTSQVLDLLTEALGSVSEGARLTLQSRREGDSLRLQIVALEGNAALATLVFPISSRSR